jgi:hypothetical protein
MSKRPEFSPEVKTAAAQAVILGGQPVAEVARVYWVDEGTVGVWVNDYHRALKHQEPQRMNAGSHLSAKGRNGTVEFDGRAVTIHRTGFRARSSIGKGTKVIPVESVAAVQWKPAGGLVNGFIEFTVPGGREGRSQMGRQTLDAATNENAVIFTKKQMPEFEVVRQAVQQAQVAQSGPQQTPGSNLSGELANLAQLHAQGVLSDAEFGAAKRRLLG